MCACVKHVYTYNEIFTNEYFKFNAYLHTEDCLFILRYINRLDTNVNLLTSPTVDVDTFLTTICIVWFVNTPGVIVDWVAVRPPDQVNNR